MIEKISPQNIKEIKRFLIVGFINTCFYYSLFALFIYFDMSYQLAVLLATAIGVFFSFSTFSTLVFDNANKKLIFKFILSYGVLYMIHIFIISKLLLYFSTLVCGFIAIFPMVVLTYIFNKFFVFKGSNEIRR